MTVETKTTIELSDVTTVEFECNKCHSITLWPLEAAKVPPPKCYCSDQPWFTIGGETYEGIASLISLMKRFKEIKKEPFIMRFGIKSVSAAGHA
jgi:hypothetical protein